MWFSASKLSPYHSLGNTHRLEWRGTWALWLTLGCRQPFCDAVAPVTWTEGSAGTWSGSFPLSLFTCVSFPWKQGRDSHLSLVQTGRWRLVKGHIWNEMALRGPRVQPGSVKEETPEHIDQTKCSFVSRHTLLCRFITSQTILIKTGIISTLSSSPAWIRKRESRLVT